MKKIVLVMVVGLVIYSFLDRGGKGLFLLSRPEQSSRPQPLANASPIEQAFAQKISNIQVAGSGKVVKLLADDLQGRRHQKFILQLPSAQTLLIVHNIDIAPRIDSLRRGDAIEFYGEYEWNPKGGLVHWTHHDPQGRHVGGWLIHNGRRYE